MIIFFDRELDTGGDGSVSYAELKQRPKAKKVRRNSFAMKNQSNNNGPISTMKLNFGK